MDTTAQNPAIVKKSSPKMVKQKFVGGGHKEHAPIASQRVEAPVAEYIDRHGSEKTPDVTQELKEAGVEVVERERPQLDQSHQQVGVTHAKESTPVILQTQSVQLPYTPVQIQTMKKESVNEGKHWLAVFVEYLGKKLQEPK
ncbi:MAG: hypothetical protein QG600_16 [Patescibacteria group bacterium]|jgi:HSP90 family molecular chaperone|nr:hypothetical protein [Patescibacteria group bacterium]